MAAHNPDDATLQAQSKSPAETHERTVSNDYSTFIPDTDRFGSLQTDAWEKFRKDAGHASAQLETDLESHFEAIQAYVNDYPAETGASSHPVF